MKSKLYLHPKMDIADAAIAAYDNGEHLTGPAGVVAFAAGRDVKQFDKALRVKALARLARAMGVRHNR